LKPPNKEPETSVRRLSTPLTEDDTRGLRVGDFVLLNGTVFTARDQVHQRIASDGQSPPVSWQEGVLYHCGPVALRGNDNQWKIIAAGPTTSIREEPYMADLIARFHLRAVIGKGGMGEHTLQACRQYGCVYLHGIGGAAQVLARAIKQVDALYWSESGLTEAIWQFQVADFPAVVTMDSYGENMHKMVRDESLNALSRLLSKTA